MNKIIYAIAALIIVIGAALLMFKNNTNDTMQDNTSIKQQNDMQEMQEESVNNVNNAQEIKQENMQPKVTIEELKKHNNKNDCWVAFQGIVYDVTNWLPKHKGGVEKIAQFCGSTDFEKGYLNKHKTDKKLNKALAEGYIIKIGELTQ